MVKFHWMLQKKKKIQFYFSLCTRTKWLKMPIPTFESNICHSLTSRVHPACVRTCSYFLSDNLPDDEDLCTCWSYTCCSPAAANATNKVSIWCNCSSKTEICTAAYSSDYLRGLVAFLTEVLDEFYQAMNHQLHSQHHIFQLLPGWCYIIYANTKKWSLRNTVNCVFFSIRYYNLRLWTKAFASLKTAQRWVTAPAYRDSFSEQCFCVAVWGVFRYLNPNSDTAKSALWVVIIRAQHTNLSNRKPNRWILYL